MIEICETMLVQLVKCIPVVFGVYLIFDFIGSLFFQKKEKIMLSGQRIGLGIK